MHGKITKILRHRAYIFVITICPNYCTHLYPTPPLSPMWAAFRTGSAWRRCAGRCGHRLTACLRFGYRGGKPLRHPISPPPNPRTRLLSVATIAHCASIRHRKCLRLRLWLAIYGVAGAHTARSVAIGYRLAMTPD